jgi:succinate dehydrogenase/fumarate reductase flavoprotein subunit
MWRQVGIMRNGPELRQAVEKLRALRALLTPAECRADHELRNVCALAELIAACALAREESRGSHYRADFPYQNDEDFAKHSMIQSSRDVRFEP